MCGAVACTNVAQRLPDWEWGKCVMCVEHRGQVEKEKSCFERGLFHPLFHWDLEV